MTALLHPDFLDNESNYREAEQFWSSLVAELAEEYGYSYKPYLNVVFADGNPIFHAYFPDANVAIRIIQHPYKGNAALSHWVKDTEWEDGSPLKELVILLVLDEATRLQAIEIMRQWLEKASR